MSHPSSSLARGGGTGWAPRVTLGSSPNVGGPRSLTLGCVVHSTRGGAISADAEFVATLDWFSRSSSGVSAHVVIAWDGTICDVVADELEAWHAREYNASHLGAELVQPKTGDPISDAQYVSLAWWVNRMAEKYGFTPSVITVVEHRAIPPGIRDGKTDVGPPFDVGRLLALLS